MNTFKTLLFALFVTGAVAARAEIKTETVEYKDGDTVLEGYLAYDTASGARPAVLIVHQWKGLGAYEKSRAEQLAKLGFVAFAADIYGKGIRPATMKEAGEQAGKYKGDRKLLRSRVNAALSALKANDRVDQKKIAAIGYCFGGTTVLELARSGAEIGAVASFHGGLSTPTPEDAKNIKCKVVAYHGADDPNVPPAEVAAFEDEMRAAKVDWQLVKFGGAVHSFSDKSAGNDNSKGAAYNENADRRSWAALMELLKEL